MPCPLFEPRERLSAEPQTFRLPLLYEFSGICHSARAHLPAQTSFHFCNHGYAQGHCSNFPPEISLSALRFNVIARTDETLHLLIIEEEKHWPRTSVEIEYRINEQRLIPEIEDLCRRAQITAFCKSFLERFAAPVKSCVLQAET